MEVEGLSAHPTVKRGPLRSARRALKSLLTRSLGLLRGGSELTTVDQIDWSIVRKVLLIRPNFRMGNLLLTTTALPILRANFPRAQIDMLCPASFRALLANHPDVDNVHTFTRWVLLNPIRLWLLMRRIRAEDYDVVIDGTLTGSAALLTRWSGGWLRIGTGPESRHHAFTTIVPEPPRKIWRVEAMRHYFAGMGLRVPPDAGMKIQVTPAEAGRAAGKWQRMGWDESTAVTGVFIGARGEKRWPVENWAALITRLWESRSPGEGLVVFHGSEELDLMETLEEMIPPDIPVSYSKGVRQFAALVARCRQFVSCDTGPMHLACALGVPVVSIFWGRSWNRFAPQRAVDVVAHSDDVPTPEMVFRAHRRQSELLTSQGRVTPAELG